MRICLISGEYPPMQGGVGDYTREMARAYTAAGHAVTVLTSSPDSEAPSAQQEEGIDVRRIVRVWNRRSWSPVCDVLREVAADVVNVQYQAAAYAMQPAVHLLPWRVRRLSPRPRIVVTYHDLRVPYLFPKAGPLRWWAVLALARWSDGVIVTNAEDEATLARYRFIRHMARIPIGSNIAVSPPAGFSREAWRAARGVQPDDLLLAYFGFLNESKGGETLIRALGRLHPRYKLLMVGGRVGSSDPTNAAYAARIDRLIARVGLGDRVLSTGYVPPEEVSAALLAADIGVLPYRDGISLRRGSLMALFAHGLPVVSTRYPAPKKEIADPAEWWHPAEVIEGENAVLVPPEDEVALSAAIQELGDSPALRAQLGEGAKRLAASFAWPDIAQRTVEFYHGLLV